MDEIEKMWGSLVPHRPFEYVFVDDFFNRQYLGDQRFGENLPSLCRPGHFHCLPGVIRTHRVHRATKKKGNWRTKGPGRFDTSDIAAVIERFYPTNRDRIDCSHTSGRVPSRTAG